MSFKDLYAHCQGLATPIDVDGIRVKIREIIPGRRVAVVRSTLDPDLLLGYYIAAKSEDTLFFGCPGSAVIVLSKDLNYCWSRFVLLKELMHLMDDELEWTNTGDELEMLLIGLCDDVDPTAAKSSQYRSELACFWMALSLLCPEAIRVDLQQRRESKTLSDGEIAHMLKIPERYVPRLFVPTFKNNVKYLLR